MIEYLLARPFTILFSFAAVFYSSILNFSDSPYLDLKIFIGFFVLFISLVVILKKNKYIFIAFIIPFVLFVNIYFHIQQQHKKCELSNEFETKYAALAINNSTQLTNSISIEATVLSAFPDSKVKLTVPLKINLPDLFYGDTLYGTIRMYPVRVNMSRCFNSFDKYLIHQHIYYKGELMDSDYVIKKYTGISIQSASQKISQICRNIFQKNIPEERTANLIIALLLGDKSNLDTEIKSDFINTGTAHILAVSGLHLGMIYGLIHSILSIVLPDKKNTKRKQLKLCIILAPIWAFACISGLGASVVRSAVMFSMLEFGKLIHKNSDSVNSLFSCGFLMIFMNPCTLYDIGFQLSFIAVLSILLFNPILSRIYIPGNRILKSVNDLVTVTTSVQIMVTPIGIYYFQQFPLYFILSNMIWVPLSFIIMLAGISLIIFSFYSLFLTNCIATLCIYLCKTGLIWFELVRHLPASHFGGLWISYTEVVIYLSITVLVFFWFKVMYKPLLFIAAILMVALPVYPVISSIHLDRSSELIIYKEDKSIQLDIREGFAFYTTCLNSKTMKNYRISSNAKILYEINQDNFEKVVSMRKVNLLHPIFHSLDLCIIHTLPLQEPLMIQIDHSPDKSALITSRFNKSYSSWCDSLKANLNLMNYNLRIEGPFIQNITSNE